MRHPVLNPSGKAPATKSPIMADTHVAARADNRRRASHHVPDANGGSSSAGPYAKAAQWQPVTAIPSTIGSSEVKPIG